MLTNLYERMKEYEQMEAGRRFLPRLPICARMDGRKFSNFTRSMEKPFDQKISECMINTTELLVKDTNAVIGYTQSDEISLIFYADEYDSQIFFDSKIQKMASILASMCTSFFQSELAIAAPDKMKEFPLFDCRVWQVPNKDEAANVLLWRELDATRNSISMAAQAKFSHKELLGKSSSQMQEMLFSKHGINWNDYDTHSKRGSYYQKKQVTLTLTPEELNKIPEKFRPTDGQVERSRVTYIHMPPLIKVTNKVEVVFDGANPRVNIGASI